MKGYIQIHRKLLDSEVFSNPISLKIWIWCLIKANFKAKFVSVKTGRGETTVKVERGQFLFGRYKAENELNIKGTTVYSWMKKFEKMEMITIISNSHYSVVTICNYDDYQSDKDDEMTPNWQATDRQLTGNWQANDTTNNDNNDNKEYRSSKLLLSETMSHDENINYENLVNFFNLETNGIFGKVIYPISDMRKKSVKARISEHGKERFVEVIKKAAASDFLKGQNQRGFMATFDWIIKPSNFDKILSGNYDNKNYGNYGNQQRKKSITDDEIFEAVASGIARAKFEKRQQ